MNQKDHHLILKAHLFAKEKHGDTLDDEGKNYFVAHVCQTVDIITQITHDANILAAAYLHDVVEDCKVTHKELVIKFNTTIADLVLEVTHEGKKDTEGYYFPRLKSKEGILIKFADRLSNLSRMNAWNEKRKEQYLIRSVFWKKYKEVAKQPDRTISVSHGRTTHPIEDQHDCMECLDCEIEFLEDMRKAGGKTKFIEQL